MFNEVSYNNLIAVYLKRLVVSVRFIKGVLFVCFIWGKAAVPAAVSSMLNAMQSLDVAVCFTNQSDCCASVLTHNYVTKTTNIVKQYI